MLRPPLPDTTTGRSVAAAKDFARRINRLERESREPVETVSTLPANPLWGEEIDFQNTEMKTAGVRWRFRYNGASASTHKWEFVGGMHLATAILGNITTTSTTYVAMTGSPELTVPLNGDYALDMAITIVPATPSIASAAVFLGATQTACRALVSGAAVCRARPVPIESAASGGKMSIMVENASAVSTQFVDANIVMLPIRVG